MFFPIFTFLCIRHNDATAENFTHLGRLPYVSPVPVHMQYAQRQKKGVIIIYLNSLVNKITSIMLKDRRNAHTVSEIIRVLIVTQMKIALEFLRILF